MLRGLNKLYREPAEIGARAACLQLALARWTMEAAHFSGHSDKINESCLSIRNAATATDLQDFMTQQRSRYFNAFYNGFVCQRVGIPRIPKIPQLATHFSPTHLFKLTDIQPAKPQSISEFLSKCTATISDEEFSLGAQRSNLFYERVKLQKFLDLKAMDDVHISEEIRKRVQDSPSLVMKLASHAKETGLTSVVDGDLGVLANDKICAYNQVDSEELQGIIKGRWRAFLWAGDKGNWSDLQIE